MNKLIANEDIGKLIIRLSIGILMLFHGFAKFPDGAAQITYIQSMLSQKGLPEFMAYAVLLGEVVGPLLIILGIYTKLGAGLVAINMLVALFLAHANHLFSLTKFGGWASELQGLFLFGALAIVFLGSGRYAIRPGK